MKRNHAIAFSALGLVLALSRGAEARISSLSDWSFQDRQATPRGGLDQSAGFRLGWDGIPPPGADRGANFFHVPYQVAYGVHDQAEIGASWGLLWADRDGRSAQFGISDFTAAGRYRLYDADRATRMPGLDLEFGFSFPTASYEKGLGTGGLGILFNWGVVLPLDPLRAHFGMGFRYNTENSDDVKVGSVFSYNAGLSLPLDRAGKKDVAVTGELKGFNHARNKLKGSSVGSTADELYLAPGALWKTPWGFQLHGAFLLGLTGASSNFGTALEARF